MKYSLRPLWCPARTLTSTLPAILGKKTCAHIWQLCQRSVNAANSDFIPIFLLFCSAQNHFEITTVWTHSCVCTSVCMYRCVRVRACACVCLWVHACGDVDLINKLPEWLRSLQQQVGERGQNHSSVGLWGSKPDKTTFLTPSRNFLYRTHQPEKGAQVRSQIEEAKRAEHGLEKFAVTPEAHLRIDKDGIYVCLYITIWCKIG